jgi:hypothetical protein
MHMAGHSGFCLGGVRRGEDVRMWTDRIAVDVHSIEAFSDLKILLLGPG